MTVVIRWEDPPRKLHPGSDGSEWSKVADELREHPGHWAVVFDGAANIAGGIANRIKKATIRAFWPAKSFEAVTRKATDESGKRLVYARYVGGAS